MRLWRIWSEIRRYCSICIVRFVDPCPTCLHDKGALWVDYLLKIDSLSRILFSIYSTQCHSCLDTFVLLWRQSFPMRLRCLFYIRLCIASFTIETFNEKGTVLSLNVDSVYDVLSVGHFLLSLLFLSMAFVEKIFITAQAHLNENVFADAWSRRGRQ